MIQRSVIDGDRRYTTALYNIKCLVVTSILIMYDRGKNRRKKSHDVLCYKRDYNLTVWEFSFVLYNIFAAERHKP